MDRRGFLKGFASGAVGWVVAGQVAGLPRPAYMGQVPLISAADAATITSPFNYSTQATLQSQAAYFPQSVAAGDRTPMAA